MTRRCRLFLMMIIVMMAGTGVIMWLGELITERGIGNGMSLRIFTRLRAVCPEQLPSIGQAGKRGSVAAIVALLLLVAIAVPCWSRHSANPGAVRQAV